MHDIDRAMFEMEHQETGHEMFETFESGYEVGNETMEFELSAELLEVTSEAELEQFLGKLISSAGSALGSFVRSDTGRALGGILKSAARQALPQVGRVLGDAIAPGMGGQFGAKAGQWLGSRFEMEGLSAEDREFESARAFVRFAQDAARQAFETAETAPASTVAQQAAIAAAQRHVPGLAPVLRHARPIAGTSGGGTGAPTGRWVRRGNRVILLGI